MIRIIAVLSVLIFVTVMYVFISNENTLSFTDQTDKHIQIITIANEIGSYAKRAEGHLLLYLMLNRTIDRNKFFQRMETLKLNSVQLIKLLNNNTDKKIANNILSLHNKVLFTAKEIILQYDKTHNSNKGFDFKLNENIIGEFHALTSDIRRKAVHLVRTSARKLQYKQDSITDSVGFERWILVIFVVTCLSLLFVIVLLSNKMKHLSQKLHEYSYVDSLTQVGNRRAFEDSYDTEWQRALREKNSLAVILIDVDSFKLINDQHGHKAGDECLANIAKTLQLCLKRPTDIIARYGGDEFVIILPNTSEAMNVAEQCRHAVDAMVCKCNNSNSLSITIGVGVFNVTPELSKEWVLQRVDQALYRGKSAGKNRVEAALI